MRDPFSMPLVKEVVANFKRAVGVCAKARVSAPSLVLSHVIFGLSHVPLSCPAFLMKKKGLKKSSSFCLYLIFVASVMPIALEL